MTYVKWACGSLSSSISTTKPVVLAEAMESEMVSEVVGLWRLHSFPQKCHPFMLALKHAGGQHGRICCCCAFSIFIYKFYSVHHLVGLNFLENEEELLLPKKASFDLCIEPSELQKSLQ